jgi:regulatory protein YycI of two-component signal transduction system YycFG
MGDPYKQNGLFDQCKRRDLAGRGGALNLGRAKIVLIYAFLGLNICLGYHLFWPNVGKYTQTAVTAADLQQAQIYLAENNYFLETEVSRSAQQGAFLTVMPAQQLLTEVVSLYQNDAVILEVNGTTYYRTSGRELIVHPSGLIQLEFLPGLFAAEQSYSLEDRDLSRLVQPLLQEHFVLPEQARFDYVERALRDRLVLHFYQQLDGIPLFAGYLKVFLERDRIVGVELYWLDLLEGPREGEMEVISATDALIKLVEELGPSSQPRDIVKAELGYFSREYNAEMWEIPPVWRILMGDGTAYYVNAFTGNLETDL